MSAFLGLVGLLAWAFALLALLTSGLQTVNLILAGVYSIVGAICISSASILEAVNKLRPADQPKVAQPKEEGP